MAGLLAARVLSDYYMRVASLIDPPQALLRPGIAQGMACADDVIASLRGVR